MSEDERPPAGTPASINEARGEIRQPAEQGDQGNADVTQDPSRAVSQFLRFYPCTRFFMVMADRQYDRELGREHCVQLLRERDTWFYWICVIADYLLILAAAVGVLTLGAIVIYKSVWL